MASDDDTGGRPSSEESLPGGLNRTIDLDLEGRRRHPTIRRSILALFALIAVAALAGAFGQVPQRSTAAGGEARLSLEAPDRLRSGLMFAARIDISAGPDGIGNPRIELSPGWIDHVTTNTLHPEPRSQSGMDGSLQLIFDPIGGGETLTLWTHWQVNPTTNGRFDGDVRLFDGDRLLTEIDRTVTIFP